MVSLISSSIIVIHVAKQGSFLGAAQEVHKETVG
jgi:hypothetical protein